MSDWLGLGFFVLLIVGAIFGLRALAKPRTRTAEEFEKGAAENASFTGALLNALHDVTDPSAKRAKVVRQEMKEGRYQKKKREGKANGSEPPAVAGGLTPLTDNPEVLNDDLQPPATAGGSDKTL